MVNTIDHEKTIDSQCIKAESLGSLISFMENNEEPWGVKDCSSRFVYANKSTLRFSGLPSNFKMENKLDSECSGASWADFEADLQKQDREVEKNKKRGAMIQTNLWGREHTLCEKFPLFNNDKQCIGTVYHVRKFNFVSLYELFNDRMPSVLTTTPPDNKFKFTEKELEIIFCLLHTHMSAKEIGKKLNLSHRTVENKLQVLYKQKAGVNSSNQLREFCRAEGFDQYIPARFFKAGVQFI